MQPVTSEQACVSPSCCGPHEATGEPVTLKDTCPTDGFKKHIWKKTMFLSLTYLILEKCDVWGLLLGKHIKGSIKIWGL